MTTHMKIPTRANWQTGQPRQLCRLLRSLQLETGAGLIWNLEGGNSALLQFNVGFLESDLFILSKKSFDIKTIKTVLTISTAGFVG